MGRACRRPGKACLVTGTARQRLGAGTVPARLEPSAGEVRALRPQRGVRLFLRPAWLEPAVACLCQQQSREALSLLFCLWISGPLPGRPQASEGETQGGSWLSHGQLGAPASPGLAGCACPCPHAQPASSTGCTQGQRVGGGRRVKAAFDRRGQRCPVEQRAAGQPVTSEFQTDNRSFLV